MKIQTIQYANPEQSTLIVNDIMSVPWPCHTWHNELIQEWLDAGNVIAPYSRFSSSDKARETLTKETYAHAKLLLNSATSDYSPAEMLRWPQLEAEAKEYKAGKPAGPYLSKEAAGGKRTIDALTDIVVAKANTLETYRVAVIKARTAIVQFIETADESVLEAYDVTNTSLWP